jgi:hypothetical protein
MSGTIGMARRNDAFSNTFMESLRRDTERWKAELSMLDVGDRSSNGNLQTSQLKAWIEAGEAIFARYETRRASKFPTFRK